MSFIFTNPILSKPDVRPPIFTRWLPLLLCIILFVFYFIVSFISKGYYQHDELGHMTQILGFWREPLFYLTDSWSRGGYKILYAIPTLFGYHAVVTTNILFTVGAAWNAYRIARTYELKYVWLAILLTGLQPFVINLSFRCYAEVPAMFFITMLVYLYQQKKWIPVALVASYLFTIRAELSVFALMLGMFFLIKKKWIPFLCLGIAPVILNILGFCLTGDPLYLWHLMVQGGLKDTYLRMGFFYFWLMLPEISGIVIIFTFITGYLSLLFWKMKKWTAFKQYHAVLIVFTIYFLMHCAFTSQTFGFGRSGGVGRFMLVILPMIAVIGLIGINYLAAAENKWQKLAICSFAFLLLLLLLCRIDKVSSLVYNGYTTLNFKTYNIAALSIAYILAIALIFKTESRAIVAGSLALIVSLYTLKCFKPFPFIGEDKNMAAAAIWLFHSDNHPRQVYANHPVAGYEYGRLIHNLWFVKSYNLRIISDAKPGDIFIIDQHYTDGRTRKQLLSSEDFKILQKIDLNNTKQTAWVVERK